MITDLYTTSYVAVIRWPTLRTAKQHWQQVTEEWDKLTWTFHYMQPWRFQTDAIITSKNVNRLPTRDTRSCPKLYNCMMNSYFHDCIIDAAGLKFRPRTVKGFYGWWIIVSENPFQYIFKFSWQTPKFRIVVSKNVNFLPFFGWIYSRSGYYKFFSVRNSGERVKQNEL